MIDLTAHRIRIPSVLLLMGLGAAVANLVPGLVGGYSISMEVITGLGLLGLALIVMEGSMGLKWSGQGETDMARSGGAAIAGITGFLVPATLGFHFLFDVGWRIALLNAIPFSVISSAIAIPSASRLPERTRRFVSVESSISDIAGVLVFNAVAVPAALGFATIVRVGWNAALVAILSLLIIGGTLKIMRHSSQGVRFIPLLASLIFFFAIGKWFHLPSLLLVFLFGIAVANLPSIRLPPVRNWLMHEGYSQDFHLLETMVKELAFLARTFFFFLFGYSMDWSGLGTPMPWVFGGGLLALVYCCRYLVLRSILRGEIRKVVFIAPRGLITILLFGMIPLSERIGAISSATILVVVLGTTLGQILAGKDVSDAAGVPNLAEILPATPSWTRR